jgi:hypothetical protein
MWVSWKFEKRRNTSRVLDFSVSGAFIESPLILEIGTPLKLIFAMPEGEIKVDAVVRSIKSHKGMGVEFVSVGGNEFKLILKAIKRLEVSSANRKEISDKEAR